MCDNTFENMRSRDIQIRKCEWSHGCKMTQSKLRIKNSKLLGGLSLHLNHLYSIAHDNL